MTTDQTIEQEAQTQGTALSATAGDTESGIAAEYYFSAAEGVAGNLDYNSDVEVHVSLNTLVFCVLVPNSGPPVAGQSSCVSLDSFIAETARKEARADALTKIAPPQPADVALSPA